MKWISPDGFSDPATAWNNESNAYDGKTTTYTRTAIQYGLGVKTPWLYLTFKKPVRSTKLRFYDAWDYHPYSDVIEIQVKKNGAWILVYSGSTPKEAWQEQSFLPIGGFTDADITEVRVRLWHDYPGSYNLRFYDFQLWGEVLTPPPAKKGRVYVYAVADSEEVDASFLINREGPYDTGITGKTLDLDPNDYTLIGNYKGQTDKKTVTIEEGDVKSVTLTFTEMHKFTIVSNPSPINFTFNTEAQSTPFVRELVSGTYAIVFPKSWMIGLDEYVFEQWENGSRKPTRTVTLASPQEVTLTATYRLRQIDEAGPINQRQMKDTLQEVVGQGADLSPTNPLPTEDTGVHSNPEKFVQDHKFSSWPIDRAGAVATLLYGVASPAAHRRTAGRDITVWWIYFYNHSGGQATVWLESPLGTVISGTVQLADNQGVMLNVKPLDVGNQEIFVNASANNVQAQIGGIET